RGQLVGQSSFASRLCAGPEDPDYWYQGCKFVKFALWHGLAPPMQSRVVRSKPCGARNTNEFLSSSHEPSSTSSTSAWRPPSRRMSTVLIAESLKFGVCGVHATAKASADAIPVWATSGAPEFLCRRLDRTHRPSRPVLRLIFLCHNCHSGVTLPRDNSPKG